MIATCAPSSRHLRVMERPRPEPPPVTSARFPANASSRNIVNPFATVFHGGLAELLLAELLAEDPHWYYARQVPSGGSLRMLRPARTIVMSALVTLACTRIAHA